MYKKRLFGIIAIVAIIGFAFITCDNGGGGNNNNNNNNNNGGGGGINTYISYDGEGSRYKLVVTENSSRAAFTPQNGDTYTLTVEGFGWGTSTGTVTSFSGGSYTLSNNGTALNLATSSEAISSIPEAIVYDAGEYSQMSDGTKTPNGSVAAQSKYFDTWVLDDKKLTITATGWTFSSPGDAMELPFNYSGTYAIVETTAGTAYDLYNGSTKSYMVLISNYEVLFTEDGPVINNLDYDILCIFDAESGSQVFRLTRQ